MTRRTSNDGHFHRRQRLRSGTLGFSLGSSDYKASAIGDAQEMATQALVAAIVAKKDRLD